MWNIFFRITHSLVTHLINRGHCRLNFFFFWLLCTFQLQLPLIWNCTVLSGVTQWSGLLHLGADQRLLIYDSTVQNPLHVNRHSILLRSCFLKIYHS